MSATFTIANGASLSDAKKFEGALPSGILMPSAWTTANLTFQVSLDGTNFFNVFLDDDSELTVSAAASRFILFKNISQLFGIAPTLSIKIRSGTAGAPVNQGAARTIEVVVA